MSSPPAHRAWPVRPLLAVLGVALAGCGGSAISGRLAGSSLTRAQAVAVVRAYDRANAKAAYTLDTRLQNQHEEGVTARMDDAYFRALRLLGRHSESPTATPPAWSIQVDVPRPAPSPADFLAVVSLPGHAGYGRGLLVLRKDSTRASWRTAYEVDLPAGAALPALGTRAVAPDPSAVRRVAAYWRSGSVRATTPHGLAAGRFTTQLAQSFRAANAATLSQHRARETERILVDPARPVAFGLRGGGRLEFAAIDVAFHVRQLATTGRSFVQPPTRGALPPYLAPGRYTAFSQEDIFQLAMVVPPGGRPVQVLGLYTEMVGATGSSRG